MPKRKHELKSDQENFQLKKENKRLKKQLAAARFKIKIKNLYNKIDNYISLSLSTSTNTNKSNAEKKCPAKIIPVEELLSTNGIDVGSTCSSNIWKNFCESISGEIDDKKTEKKGIHPIIKLLLQETLQSIEECSYRLNYERSYINDDKAVKIPDFSISKNDCVSLLLRDNIFPIEIKKEGVGMQSARVQAAGYLLSKLRDRLELVDLNKSHKIFGFCAAICGFKISIGHVCIENLKLAITFSNFMVLWDSTCISKNATEGFTALRTLLMQSPKTLGHTRKYVSFYRSDSVKIKLKNVLGKGSFCVAFSATIKNSRGKKGVVLKKPIKPESTLSDSPEDVAISLSQLIVENRALQAFTLKKCDFLPHLYDAQWEVSEEFAYIASQPEGIPLRYFSAMLSKKERTHRVMTLYSNLIAGLAAALDVGFCHTDLRPDNVIVVGEIFVIIDWGLAVKPYAIFHEYRAGIDFYHDDIVFNEDKALRFKTEFDKFSAKCIAYFFAEKWTPWTKVRMDSDGYISFTEARRNCLSNFHFEEY